MGAEIDRLEVEIEASAKAANSQIEELAKKLESVAKVLNGINTKKLDSLANGLGKAQKEMNNSVNVKQADNLHKISKAFGVLSNGIEKSHKSIRSFSQIAGRFYANSFLIIRGIKSLWKSTEKSMDYTETFNYWNVTLDKIGQEFKSKFGDYGCESADEYAESFKQRLNSVIGKMTGYTVGSSGELISMGDVGLGLDPEQLMNYQAQISSVTNSLGLAGETSIDTAKALSMLSADMSSFTNTNLSTVMTNLQSGLIGQSRALYKYGIDITNATLQMYAYKNGISVAVSEMTQADKMRLRLLAILDQSKVAWGDQANTLNSVSNQYRILKQQISNLARTLGNLLLPIVKTVLPVVNGLVIALRTLFETLGFHLFGGNWLKDLQDGISSGYENSGLGDLADSAGDAEDSLDGANKAAKKLKNTVLGIDELNINNPDDSNKKSDGVGGGIDLSGAIGDALAEYESIWEKAFENSKNKAQEYADAICAVFNKTWKAIEPFRESVKSLWNKGLSMLGKFSFEALKDFCNEFLVPIGKWAFGKPEEGITRLVDVINSKLMSIDWVGITGNLKEFWKAIEPYAEQFGEGLIDFFEDVSRLAVGAINTIFGEDGTITELTNWLNNNDSEKARKWAYTLSEFAVAILAFQGIASAISGIANMGIAFKALSEGMTALFGAGGLFADIGASFAKFFKLFAPAGKVYESIGMLGVNLSIFAESLTGIAVPVGVSMAAIAASIVTVVGGLAYVFATNEDVRQSFSEAVSSIGTGLGNIANVILPCLKEAWDGLLKILAPLGTFLEEEFTSIWQDMLNPALSYIGETVLPKLSKALESLWNNVLAPLGEFIGSVLAPIIQIISDMLSIFWQNVIVPLADAIGRILGASIEGIIDIFGRLTEIIHPVIEVMQFLWNKVLAPIVNYLWKVFKPMFEDVFKAIGGVVDGLADTFSGLITFITGVFTGDWEKAWQGVQDIFKGIFNGLISIVEGVINFIIDGLNGFLGTFDGIVTSIGEVIGIDISIPEIPTISIPRFENGGYVTSGQIFMARENGINEMVGRIGNQNAVVNNDQIVAGITAGVQAGMNVDEQISLMRMMIELLRDIREKDPGIVFDTKEGLEALRERSERNGFSFT